MKSLGSTVGRLRLAVISEQLDDTFLDVRT